MGRSNAKAIAGLLAVAAALAGFWWFLLPPPSFITGIHPIDGHLAAFTTRHNPKNGPARAWIGVLDVDEGVLWSRELPAMSTSTAARHGLTVSDDQVTVKVSDIESHAQVLSFDLVSGAERWKSGPIELQPSEHPNQPYTVYGARPFDDGIQLIHGDHDRVRAQLVARDATTGTTQWSQLLTHDPIREMSVTDHALIYRDQAGWTLLDRKSGAPARTLDLYSSACVSDDSFAVWADDTLTLVDLTTPGGEFPERSQHLPLEGIVTSCGEFRGELVFVVAKPWIAVEDRAFELVGVNPDPATVSWRLDLGPWEPSTLGLQSDNRGRRSEPLRGPIAPFAPILLGQHNVDELKLAVVNMVTHEIAWESRAHAELLYYQLFRASGDQHFLTSGSDLIALDGETGNLTAALKLGHETVRSFYAHDSRVWLYSSGYARVDSLPWVAVHGRTLEVIGQGDPEYAPTDATEELRTWLGAP